MRPGALASWLRLSRWSVGPARVAIACRTALCRERPSRSESQASRLGTREGRADRPVADRRLGRDVRTAGPPEASIWPTLGRVAAEGEDEQTAPRAHRREMQP